MGFRDNQRGGGFSRGGDRGGSSRGGFGRGNSFGRGGDRGGSGGRGRSFERREVEMHDAVCDQCHKNCQVPFRPTGDKPVLCSDCFKEKDPRNNRGSGSGSEVSSDQMKQINTKLDKILAILEQLEVVEGEEDLEEDDSDEEAEDDEDSEDEEETEEEN